MFLEQSKAHQLVIRKAQGFWKIKLKFKVGKPITFIFYITFMYFLGRMIQFGLQNQLQLYHSSDLILSLVHSIIIRFFVSISHQWI